MTAAGRVVLRRRSPLCPACGAAAYPADDRVGLGGFPSPGATRLACLVAAGHSFAVAADRLEELAGIRPDDETIRRHVHRAAAGLADRREAAPPAAAFAAARGGRVPRRRGDDPDPRRLARAEAGPVPGPAAGRAGLPGGVGLARVARPVGDGGLRADAEAFAARWGPRAEAPGVDPSGPLTVLGGGAEWIWGAAARQFPAAAQVLDIFHAGGHIAAALYGEGAGAAGDWLDRGRRALLADGWPGLLDHVGATPGEGRTAAGQAAIDGLPGYFAEHTDRVGSYGRLRSGRPIGSGGVEGLARRMGRRLKVPGRGWCAGNIDGMAALIATVDTPEWDSVWTRPAA